MQTHAAFADAGTILPPIRGLEEYWAIRTWRSRATMPSMQARLLLDVLGLGLEQTMTWLGREEPDYATFQQWIRDTAGPPEPLALARYHAWLDGAPPPEPVSDYLREIEQAPPVFDADDLSFWDEQGYVILRHAISPAAAKAAEELLWHQVQARKDDPGTWYVRRSNGIMVQHFQDPALDAARRSPRVHKAFAQLWGTADLWMTTDRMSFNPPERPGHPFPGPNLHWDVSLSLPIPFATQGILYLTDTSANQGAFQLVPGFHHRLETWLEEIGGADPRRVDLSGAARCIPAGAGDLIIWRQDLPHGASPNSSDRPRMAQYVNMYSPALTSHPVWR